MEQISNRKFGLFLSIMLLFIAFYLFEQPYSFSFKLFASLFLLLTTFTVFIPKALLPLKHLWFLIGFWLGRFISPLVLGLIYFLIIILTAFPPKPTALIKMERISLGFSC